MDCLVSERLGPVAESGAACSLPDTIPGNAQACTLSMPPTPACTLKKVFNTSSRTIWKRFMPIWGFRV